MTNTPVSFTKQLAVVNPHANIDNLYGTYNTISEALTATANLREIGRTVAIMESGSAVEYWFKSGILDSDLVVKTPPSTGGSVTSVSGTNGVLITNPTTTPNISLGNITPTSVAATGTVTGSNISGTNTGDNALNTSSINYTDTSVSTRVSKLGDIMTGQLKTITPVADEDAANKGYVNGRIVAFNSETKSYTDRMAAVGNTIDYATATAFDDFVTAGKRTGYMSKVKFFAPLWGYDLTGSLIKFTVDAGGSSSMVNGNLTASDYDILKGLKIANSTNKFVSTGLIPANNGLTASNIGWGLYVPDYTISAVNNGGYLISDVNATNSLIIAGHTGTTGFTGRQQRLSVGGKRQVFVNYPSSTTFNAYLNGENETNSFTTTAFTSTLTGEVELFRAVQSSSVRYLKDAQLSYVIFTEGLTEAQALSLNKELYRLYQRLGRISTTGSITAFFGDSNTAGQGVTNPGDRFSVQVAAATGAIEFNLGMPSSQLTQNIVSDAGVLGGYQRYTTLLKKDINTLVIIYGTNDMNQRDATTTGDTTILLDFRTKLEEIIQAFKDKGVRVLVGSVPYGTAPSSTKLNAWMAAGAIAAKNKGVPFVDLVTLFTDTDAPTSYLSDGTLHFNSTGHKLISDKLISALNGVLYRQPVIDFGSIAAGGTAFVDIPIPNITKNNAVSTPNFPDLTAAGLMINAEIFADDTVRIRAYNPTNAAIDPSPFRGMIKVIIN